ncbi:tetratricopeptide repeat protein|uniref:nuclear transport factor 2 family protein n=1 Tax=Noviherbaspirillum sp. L7-7A TaxID=2850560 RepID=UPI001C2C17B2|nr:tetratricopeptide repeat protein [Noviherbaspirillum sp. L7-7A]MBV0879632.1 tetratricopeptide repeat protein [Noviherbaspirillum sp. L7-7A]
MVISHLLKRCRRHGIRSGAAILLAGVIAGNLQAGPVDEQADITRLMQSGQLAEALRRVEGLLMLNPGNAKMRFNKAIILAQQGKTPEAITLLLKLTEDYPDLPEPYNNLAVLYAANGQYESARIALDKATANNPGYGMAFENLGDIYIELASQAYEKAAKLDGNANARAKVAALRGNVQSAGGVVKPVALPVKGALAMADNTAAVARPAQDKGAAQKSTTEQTAPASNSEQAAVLDAIKAWANAWSARDVNGYLAAYSSDFVTPRGMSHGKWAAERTERITSKQHITVKVEAAKVTLNGDRATVQFTQHFSSDKLRSTDQKTLMLIRRDGAWRIREERVG